MVTGGVEGRILGLPRRAWGVAAGLAALYSAVLGGLSVRHVLAGQGTLLDLGIFDQVAWNTARGRLFWDTIDPVARHSFLGQHASPALLVTGAVYALVPWGGPLRLVLLQTLCLAAAALPLAWLAGQTLGYRSVPGVVAAYLLAPALAYVNLFDFHEVVLAVPALALACAFLHAGRWTPLALALGFVLLCKEDMALVVASFGVYLAITYRGRPRWLGMAVLLVSAAWALGVVTILVPYFRGAPYVFGDRYAGGLLGSRGAGGLHLSYLLSWWTPRKGTYLLVLLGPWLGLPLLAGRKTLLCLAPLATSLLSTYPAQADYHNQYAAPFLPLGMACALWALGGLRGRGFGRARSRATVALVAALVPAAAVATWLVGPLPGTRAYTAAAYQPPAGFAQAEALLARVPASASLATVNRFGAYVAERPWLWHVPRGVGQASWVLVMAGDRRSYDYHPDVIAGLSHDRRYALAARRDNVLLFHRRFPASRS
ncbi:MAG: DUF2079 domain-containing protein [Chloroflexota bacterium]